MNDKPSSSSSDPLLQDAELQAVVLPPTPHNWVNLELPVEIFLQLQQSLQLPVEIFLQLHQSLQLPLSKTTSTLQLPDNCPFNYL